MQFQTDFLSLVFSVESLVSVFKSRAGNSDGFKKRKSPTWDQREQYCDI